MSQSEFGRGYVTCLVQFWNHRARLDENEALYGEMATKYPGDFLDGGAEVWANGASDHLYELKRAKGVSHRDWVAARTLQERALDIGHGYRPTSRSDVAECRALLAEADRLLTLTGVTTLDEALSWDVAHGLRPEVGDWKCPENIVRKKVPA